MDYVRNMDLFPAYTGLTNNGKTEFKTLIGGFYTIIITVLAIVHIAIIIAEPLKTPSSNL